MPATGVVDHARSPSRQRKAIETAETSPKRIDSENACAVSLTVLDRQGSSLPSIICYVDP